jgi:CheY-like chemotaxis protein
MFTLMPTRLMSRHRIAALVVEDDPDLATLLEGQLALDPAYERIELAGDGSRALALLDSGFVPQVVLLDLELPKVHGRDVLRRLREDPRFARTVVVITGSEGRPDPSEASLLGEVWLPKPFGPEDLSFAIQKAVARLEPDGAGTRPVSRGAISA